MTAIFIFENIIAYCGPIRRNLHFPAPVPVDHTNSIASKIDATHVIKAHSIIQFVMPWNAGKWIRVSRFSNFLGEAPRPSPACAFGAHVGASPPPVPLSDGLDTRLCQILDPSLFYYVISLCFLIFVSVHLISCHAKRAHALKYEQVRENAHAPLM